MTETLKILENSTLPRQLNEYFSGSKKIQKLITAETLEDIEDLYLFYESQFSFDLAEFGMCVIDSLIKCKDFSSYYFYLKKILENHLDVELKDENSSVRIKKDVLIDTFTKSATEIFTLLSIESDEKMNQINFHLGKLEFINELIGDTDYFSLYEKLTQLKDSYYRKRNNLPEE